MMDVVVLTVQTALLSFYCVSEMFMFYNFICCTLVFVTSNILVNGVLGKEALNLQPYDDINSFKSANDIKFVGVSEGITRGPDYKLAVKSVAFWVCRAWTN